MIALSLVASRLKLDEGVRLKPYRDTMSKTTIGTGRNLTDVGISMDENDFMLNNDIHIALEDIQLYDWFMGLDPPRQLVVLCMMFNMGPLKFKQFQNMIRDIESNDYQSAAMEMANSAWAGEVGNRAVVYEQIMRTGILPA